MKLIPSLSEHISELTRISKAAFETDIDFGSMKAEGPPGYDSADFHAEMLAGGHLYTLISDKNVIGGAIIFVDEYSDWHMYIGRIFISPNLFRTGCGKALMGLIETLYPSVTVFTLDTPEWNTRTNPFYLSLGYKEISRANGEIRYQKQI